MECTCDYCGKSFNRKKSQVEKYKNNFCSLKCRKDGMLNIATTGQFKVVYDHIKDNKLLCTNCGEYKDFDEFTIRTDLPHRNGRDYMCRDCSHSSRVYSYKSRKPIKIAWRNTVDGYLKNMLQNVRYRRKDKTVSTELTFEYIKEMYNNQNGKCAISGVDMTTIAGKGRIITNISIDRIDSSIGYEIGNIQLVCDIVNRMKSDSTQDEFIKWCSLIINNLKHE